MDKELPLVTVTPPASWLGSCALRSYGGRAEQSPGAVFKIAVANLPMATKSFRWRLHVSKLVPALVKSATFAALSGLQSLESQIALV